MATLMLVDDEPSIIEVYRNILEIKSHQIVAEASDGDEALLVYSMLDKKPDIVLMDHRMPRSNGITAMKNIHMINPMQSIIFVTADYDAAKAAMGMGSHSFILKPFRMDALFNAIEVALADQAAKKNQIREAFLSLVTRLNTDSARDMAGLSGYLEDEVINKFLPGGMLETLTLETMANWLCKFFNIMGMEWSCEHEENKLTFRNTRCAWMDLGPNHRFCIASKCAISRFAEKTGRNFNLEHESSIMGGDSVCLFRLFFE